MEAFRIAASIGLSMEKLKLVVSSMFAWPDTGDLPLLIDHDCRSAEKVLQSTGYTFQKVTAAQPFLINGSALPHKVMVRA
jgi:hypothetical protein